MSESVLLAAQPMEAKERSRVCSCVVSCELIESTSVSIAVLESLGQFPAIESILFIFWG